MMKKVEVLETLENGGYILMMEVYRMASVMDANGNKLDTCRWDTAEKIGAMDGYKKHRRGQSAWNNVLYVEKIVTPKTEKKPEKKTYHHPKNVQCVFTASEAARLHRSGKDILVSNGVLIRGKYQPTPENENRAHCRSIANDLEDYAAGRVYRCPECNEYITLPDDVGDKYKCPDCGTVHELDDLEQQSLYDYFEDCLDVEYRVGSDKQYRSVCIMVTCGGPNIYIDTASRQVELYWWGDRASYPIDYDTCDEVDAWAEEYWSCL